MIEVALHDVEELLAERGFDVSYETIRRWVLKFGPAFARNLRRLRPRPADTWHLDEMVVSIRGRRMYLWRAVDSEGFAAPTFLPLQARDGKVLTILALPITQGGWSDSSRRTSTRPARMEPVSGGGTPTLYR